MRVCRSRQDLTFQYPCSPLVKGGEGRGEGGFEAYAFTNFGCTVGMRSLFAT
jgi:hypothetical protein